MSKNLEHCNNVVLSIPSEVLWIREVLWIMALARFNNCFNKNQYKTLLAEKLGLRRDCMYWEL